MCTYNKMTSAISDKNITHNSAVCDEEVLSEGLVAALELVLADNHLRSVLRHLVHLAKES